MNSRAAARLSIFFVSVSAYLINQWQANK